MHDEGVQNILDNHETFPGGGVGVIRIELLEVEGKPDWAVVKKVGIEDALTRRGAQSVRKLGPLLYITGGRAWIVLRVNLMLVTGERKVNV